MKAKNVKTKDIKVSRPPTEPEGHLIEDNIQALVHLAYCDPEDSDSSKLNALDEMIVNMSFHGSRGRCDKIVRAIEKKVEWEYERHMLRYHMQED